jgi:polar amino acid transport system substrate-binding protein
MKRFQHMLFALILIWLGLQVAEARADALDDIVKRGRLVVGVKRDVPLWGFTDPKTGKPAGLEPDLARDLASRLGVQLELVGLLTAERISAVEQRRVDVLIATLSDTPERQAQLDLVLPHYYASGVNVLARRSEGFRQWADLRDRRVCGRRGAFYNRPITVTYGVDIVQLYGNELAKSALKDGRCAAFLYDDTGILALLSQPGWNQMFEMPLPTLYPTPWSIALHPDQRGGRLEAMVSKTIIDWHRSNFLAQLEQRWGVPPSEFVRKRHLQWQIPAQQSGHCAQPLTATTPKECL